MDGKRMPEHIEVKKSRIHGKGLFAAQTIKKGEHIGTYKGPRAKRNGTYVLWVPDAKGKYYGISGRNDLRYLNHSSKPNAEFEGPELFATKKIRKGTEITFHYGDEWEGVK